MKKISFRSSTFLIFAFLLFPGLSLTAQETYKEDKSLVSNQYSYQETERYEVKNYSLKTRRKKPENIILMIGDGMGIAQIHAGMTANGGKLFLENFKSIGFAKTHSSDNYVTDSAAGGTALACGEKTYNHAIGVNPEKQPLKNVREQAEAIGKATGVVSTSSVTHATPASFVAHQPQRSMYETIAADYLKTDIDVFIGGGIDQFEKRKDGRNLSDELRTKGYKVFYSLDSIKTVKAGKLAGLLAPAHTGKTDQRGDLLPVSTRTAIDILEEDKDGFFLMVEGSQIDWGGHQNNTEYIVTEMLDFDRAIGEALDFAAKDGKTLVIVTADHETGGMAIKGGSYEEQRVNAGFTTTSHTGIMVPVFAFGPGAEQFTGIMDNTDIAKKIFGFLEKK